MKIFTLAEVGQAHDGSLGILHSYVDAAADAGADAVKFQIHIAEAESSPLEPFRIPFSFEDKTRFDYWKRVSFTREQWAGVKDHCDKAGVEFIASPFSVAAVRLLESLHVRRYKIASGEVDDFLMLDAVARTGKEMLISTGLSSYSDIEETLRFLKPFGNKVVLFQCATRYPAGPEETGLGVVAELAKRFGVEVGLSDHSGTIYSALAAAALGARYIECHIVFDRRMFGPDTPASLTVDEFKQLVAGLRFLERALESLVDKASPDACRELRKMFGKSLAISRSLSKGAVITMEDLESKKPAGAGIASREYKEVVGKHAARDLEAGQFLHTSDIYD